MVARLIWIRLMSTLRLVYNSSKASSMAAMLNSPMLRRHSRRMFTPRLTRLLVLVHLPLLNGVPLLQLALRPRLPPPQGKSPTGIAASTISHLRHRLLRQTVLNNVTRLVLLAFSLRLALAKNLVELSLILPVSQHAHPRWAPPLATKLLICLRLELLSRLAMSVLLVVVSRQLPGDLCLLRLPQWQLLLLVLTVALHLLPLLLLPALLHLLLITALSLPQLRSAQSAMSDHHPRVQATHTSSITMALLPRLPLLLTQPASLRVLLLPPLLPQLKLLPSATVVSKTVPLLL